jgi:PASTA domain
MCRRGVVAVTFRRVDLAAASGRMTERDLAEDRWFPGSNLRRTMKRGRISGLVCAALLLGATAATAQPACDSVSPEVRDYVRSRGACREAKKAPRPRASTQSKSGATGSPTPAQQNESIPNVIGRSYTDAARALAKFKVERVATVSDAPPGEVLAQEPAPAALGRPGSTVVLRVSDGLLARPASTNAVTAPATAAEASSAPAPATTAAPLPPQEPINPVTAPATVAAASSAPAPSTSVASATTAVPLPPQEPIDPPGARGPFPTAFVAIAALIFAFGVSLGLLAGVLLMRQRLLRGQQAVDKEAPPPTLPQRQQPVDQQLAESDAGSLSESDAAAEVRCAARLVPAATTILLGAERISIEYSSDYRREQARLHAPIEVSGDDVERALFEQSKDQSAVARVFERLRGVAAEHTADELNRALDVDILDVLAQGWVQMPAMHRAVQLSALTRGPPPMLLKVERHNISSTSHLVLDTRVGGSSLPPLELVLEIVVDVQSATLAAREGRIDLVALGEATVLALLKYKGVLVKEHATEISGTPRDPSEPRPPAAKRPASVDFPI